jgi:two-component system, OmpR family, response regulator
VSVQRVLIVDGDSDSRIVYRIVLQHHGYDTLEAEDGEAALRMIEAAPVHVVVTELTLRLVDGHTLVERLRARPDTQDICIIVVTARGLQEDRARAFRAGCTRFLLKPLEPQVLVREIGAALASQGRNDAEG